MSKKKLLKTYEILDSYEKRFACAALNKPFYMPTTDEDRKRITDKVKSMLGYDEKLIPSISNVKETLHTDCEAFTVTQLRYTTWDRVYGSASLYMPKSEARVPLAFLACGHGVGGRLYYCYRRMAERLCDMGIAVIVPDNIGQGDREFMGHFSAYGPFCAGLSLQGLIVMESIALIRHMAKDERFDTGRIAALGNSGGGTQTMLLAALCPELSVIASSGYPSEFHYVFSKEKRHCACNLLRGACSLDMWEIYSTFAPKPLLIESGCYDHYFPMEYFERCQRKISGVYALLDAESKFRNHLAKTRHGWDDEDIDVISDFLAEHLHVASSLPSHGTAVSVPDEWHVDMPDCALTTNELAAAIRGAAVSESIELWDIFKPTVNGKKIDEDEIVDELERGSLMQILAQMECALTKI